MERPIIAIPMGDPAGVGPEIAIKAAAKTDILSKARCLIVGDIRIMEQAAAFPNMPAVHLKSISTPEDGDYSAGCINVIDLHNLSPDKFSMGQVSADCGRAAYECIEKAIALAMEGSAHATATTPINKESFRAAGVPYIGHTEVFAALTGTPDPLTIFEVRGMRVFFLTRHMSLKQACCAVKKDRIIDCVQRSFKVLQQLGGDDRPFAVAGLNPHSGEHGMFGSEEVEEISPAVTQLHSMGCNVVGPIGADSVFAQAMEGRYSGVLSLYHDQGHIATKTVDFYRTISITGGMPILRTSVDHGTVFNRAGKGTASSVSMEEAILVAAKYAPAFAKSKV